jgi:hypothetical protein
MDNIAAPKAMAFWINPKTGEPQAIGAFAATGVKDFSTPEGWEDAILVLEAVGGPAIVQPVRGAF